MVKHLRITRVEKVALSKGLRYLYKNCTLVRLVYNLQIIGTRNQIRLQGVHRVNGCCRIFQRHPNF